MNNIATLSFEGNQFICYLGVRVFVIHTVYCIIVFVQQKYSESSSGQESNFV